jgi:hypothetical protein
MAITYDVYFGLPGNLVLVSEGQAGTSLQITTPLFYDTEYAWRVDAIEDEEITTGDEWTFTTMAIISPTASGGATPNGKNNIVTLKRLVVATDNKIYYEN